MTEIRRSTCMEKKKFFRFCVISLCALSAVQLLYGRKDSIATKFSVLNDRNSSHHGGTKVEVGENDGGKQDNDQGNIIETNNFNTQTKGEDVIEGQTLNNQKHKTEGKTNSNNSPNSYKTKYIRTTLGPCEKEIPKRAPPLGGFLNDIEWYKDSVKTHQDYFLSCIDDLAPSQIDNEMLIEATRQGYDLVVEKLVTEHNLDPLFLPPKNERNNHIFNAVQEAIRGGYVQSVKVLTGSNNSMVIDDYGRTVSDYIKMIGSPIRPHDAKNVLGLDLDLPDSSSRRLNSDLGVTSADGKRIFNWNNSTSFSYNDTCDIDVVHDDMSAEQFFKEYYSTGRPFVLRNHVPKEELALFTKEKFSVYYPPKRKLNVGSTAYPSLTGQKNCVRQMTIYELENATKCAEMPDLSMVHAHHPDEKELNNIFSIYDGNAFDESGGWRKINEYFGRGVGHGWQIFFGGDTSGATLHWHSKAFNILYVGTKEWRITPPYYRGFTGMNPRVADQRLDEKYTLSCTQHPGDQIFIPDFWGHLTMNHGFTIGAAVIVNTRATGEIRTKKNSRGTKKARDSNGRGFESVELPFDKDPRQILQSYHLKSKLAPPRQPQGLRNNVDPEKPPFLFVHINKTGGTSLITMLLSKCPSEYVSKKWTSKTNHRSFHATAHSYIELYGREVWDNAYTFAVVRHPLARQVSNFFFLVNNCENNPRRCSEERSIPKSVNGVVMSKVPDEVKIQAFHEWLRNLYEQYPPGSPDHYLFGSKGHGNEEYATFSSTQTSWMVDEKGEMVVKDVFRLEDLSQDMKRLTDAIPCLGLGTKLINKNVTPHYPDYMLFAKDEGTRKIIKEVYADDFKNFGYEI